MAAIHAMKIADLLEYYCTPFIFNYFIYSCICSIPKIAMYVKVRFKYVNFQSNMSILADISGICAYCYNKVFVNDRAVNNVSIPTFQGQ